MTGRTHNLYRVYAKHGGLLYIGITSCMSNRIAVHRCNTPWWWEVDEVLIDPADFHDRDAALAAERAAIQAEHPFYNKEHHGPGCPTCGSPAPQWHPREAIDSPTISMCVDVYHSPETTARIGVNVDTWLTEQIAAQMAES